MIKTIKLIDLLKYLVSLTLIILICVYPTRYFSNLNKDDIAYFFKLDYAKIIKSNIAIACFQEEPRISYNDR